MNSYLILQHPGHNRVYYNTADKLALAELQLAIGNLNVASNDISITHIAGIRYLKIELEENLNEVELTKLSRLSFFFALFQLKDNCLIPIMKSSYEFVDDKLSTLWKYPGKTNELFTKMMIHVAVLSSDFSIEEPLLLLDPVAGKGTTLFEAIIYGYHAIGVELNNKSVLESSTFFKQYLQSERFKYEFEKRQVFGKNKQEAIYAQHFRFAKNKQDFKTEENSRHLSLINGSTTSCGNYFKQQTFHLIVGDLPYGIKHKNTSKKGVTPSMSAEQLVSESAEQWYKLLKSGGTLVLGWNSFINSKKQLSGILEQAGFKVLNETPYGNFLHIVDKSIKRDILVAKK